MMYPKGAWTPENSRLVRSFAIAAHGEQKYGQHSYIKHLEDTAQVFTELVPTSDPLFWALDTAALLHDVLEDTKVQHSDIRGSFGADMADVIRALAGEGKNRKERFDSVRIKILNLGDLAEFAICIKLADRIANVENCWQTRSPLLFMYKREYSDFKWELQNIIPVERFSFLTRTLWGRLDKLIQG